MPNYIKNAEYSVHPFASYSSDNVNKLTKILSGDRACLLGNNDSLRITTHGRKKDYPGNGRQNLIAFIINEKVYVGGGRAVGSSNYSEDFYCYDKNTDSWERLSDLTGLELTNEIVFVINNKAYVSSNSSTSNFYSYNPSTDTWSPKSDYPITPRFYFVINGKGYVGDSFSRNFYSYDPSTDTWTQKSNVPDSMLSYPTSFAIGQKGYVGGGTDLNLNYMQNFYSYDPFTDTWTQIADFPTASRAQGIAFNYGNYAYVGTGFNKDPNTNEILTYGDFYFYDPNLDSWGYSKALNIPKRVEAFVCSNGTDVYFGGGGYSSHEYNDFYSFQGISVQPSFEFTPPPRNNAVSFKIGDKVYVGLGSDGSTYYSDFYTYNFSLGKWERIADFPGNPRTGSIAFVINGEAYVGLGSNRSTYYGDFYKYDQNTNSWTFVTNFPGNPRSFAVCSTIDNKAYICGGVGSSNTYYNDFYEYDPSINSWTQLPDFPGNPRSKAISFSSNYLHLFYMGLGESQGSGYNDLYSYNINSQTWGQRRDFPGTSIKTAISISDGETAYVCSGDPISSDIYSYDILGDMWEYLGSYPELDRKNAIGFSIGNINFIGLGEDNGQQLKSDFYSFFSDKNVKKIKQGIGIVDNAVIQIENNVLIDLQDAESFYSQGTDPLNEDGYYYLTLFYEWVHSIDYPRAKIQIFKPSERYIFNNSQIDINKYLLLSVFKVIDHEIVDFYDYDPENINTKRHFTPKYIEIVDEIPVNESSADGKILLKKNSNNKIDLYVNTNGQYLPLDMAHLKPPEEAVDMNGQKLINLNQTPSNDGDAIAYKFYTDDNLASLSDKSAARDNLGLAESKRIFKSTPTPPYDVGDLWERNNSIWKCIRAKSQSESYNISDWQKLADLTSVNTSSDTSNVNGLESYKISNWALSSNNSLIDGAKIGGTIDGSIIGDTVDRSHISNPIIVVNGTSGCQWTYGHGLNLSSGSSCIIRTGYHKGGGWMTPQREVLTARAVVTSAYHNGSGSDYHVTWLLNVEVIEVGEIRSGSSQAQYEAWPPYESTQPVTEDVNGGDIFIKITVVAQPVAGGDSSGWVVSRINWSLLKA